MLIAFLHFLAQLIIALALIRVVQAKLVDSYGADNSLAKALAFLS